jgi:hypothetical protein
MANQPERTPKGQISYNTGAKPASTRVGVSPKVKSQNMKRIKHNQRLQTHNDGVKGATQG